MSGVRSRRTLEVVLPLVMLCAAAGAPAARATPPGVELRVMLFHPTGLPEAWVTARRVLREFEADHPGVRVTLIPEGPGDALTKLRILLAAREPLDVAAIDVVEFSSFLADGVLLDLAPYLARDPDWREEDYFAVSLDGFRDRAGHLRGLPSTFTPYVMYVNLDLLSAAGLAPPDGDWTWDDLLRIARGTTDGQGQYGISIAQWLQALAPWVWQNGGRLLRGGEGGAPLRAAFSEPRTVEAFRFLQDLFHRERVASTDASYEGQLTRGLFQDGRVALYGPVGYWEVYRFKEIRGFRWDVRPLPRGRPHPDGSAAPGGERGGGSRGRAATSIAMRSYVAFRRTRHPELAAELVRRLSGSALSHALARMGNGIPGLISAAHSPDFLKPDVAPASEQVFLDAIEHARFLPIFASWRELEALVAEDLQQCLVAGSVDAPTACRRMNEKVDAFLDRQRRAEALPRAPVGALLAVVLALCAIPVAGFLLLRRRGRSGSSPRAGARLARREERAALRFLAPWAAGFLLFTLGPVVASGVISLTAWSPVRDLSDMRWAGLAHYRRLLDDPSFLHSLEVTALFALWSVPATIALALALALLVRHGATVARTAFVLPIAVSAVATGLVWRWLYDSSVVEALLGARWIESTPWILPGFVVMSLWGAGAPMLIFLAGLHGIDRRLYEAARLDGAGPLARFCHVTLPQLTPVLLFNLVIGVIQAFQTFAQPYVMTGGGPGDASLFLVLYLFQNAFRFHHMGYAAALGWVLFALLLVLTALLLAGSRRWVHYEGAVP